MAQSKIGGKRFFLLALAAVLVAGAVVGWAERKALLTWYYLRGLSGAEGDAVAVWAERVAGLDEAAVPDLLLCLERDDGRACANAGTALACLTERWGREDPRCVELAKQAAGAFPRFSDPGRAAALRLAAGWAAPGCPEELLSAACRLIPEAVQLAPESAREEVLALALAAVLGGQKGDTLCACRETARACLRSPEATTRVRAIQLAGHPGVDLHKEIVPLLHDPEPRVRRAAIVALGPATEVLDRADLIPWLHDPDPAVRQLCEAALCGPRGLSARQLQLGRLITHPEWSMRLQVLNLLDGAENPDALDWLRRLTHDSSPAVRAAAIRAACEDPQIDLSDRLDQMARGDESSTVSDLARYYLRRQRNRTEHRGAVP